MGGPAPRRDFLLSYQYRKTLAAFTRHSSVASQLAGPLLTQPPKFPVVLLVLVGVLSLPIGGCVCGRYTDGRVRGFSVKTGNSAYPFSCSIRNLSQATGEEGKYVLSTLVWGLVSSQIDIMSLLSLCPIISC